jgi:ABC-2 type transport system permease protein
MKKSFAVLKREYLAMVRRKMFIFMTLFFPVLFSALIILPGLMMARGLGEKKVVVLDGTGELRDAFTNVAPISARGMSRSNSRAVNASLNLQYVDGRGKNLEETAKGYTARLTTDRKAADRLDGVLVIPADAFDAEKTKMSFYSRSSTDMFTQARLDRSANRAIQRHRFAARGIDQASIAALMRDVPVEAVQISKSGEKKKGGEANFIVGFILTALVLMPSFIYGVETMRGIIQEKTDRVVEILVSSMSPAQLLTGKVTGMALVGLTQIAVWLTIAGLAASFGAAYLEAAAGINVMQWVRPSVFVYFIGFFLLAYFTYVCIYAIGGAVCNSEKEAQQLIAPISLIMLMPWFLMVGIITNPDSSLAVGFSMAPVFGPITMFVRTLVSEPPVWHIVTSIAVSLATIATFYWITAKIFRIGILSYGKRPTIPELWQWLKVA